MKEHGPFDGFITFSGGQTLIRYMYRILFEIDPGAYPIILEEMPTFLISAGATLSYDISFEYN
jgi:hypothetical protein